MPRGAPVGGGGSPGGVVPWGRILVWWDEAGGGFGTTRAPPPLSPAPPATAASALFIFFLRFTIFLAFLRCLWTFCSRGNLACAWPNGGSGPPRPEDERVPLFPGSWPCPHPWAQPLWPGCSRSLPPPSSSSFSSSLLALHPGAKPCSLRRSLPPWHCSPNGPPPRPAALPLPRGSRPPARAAGSGPAR